LSGLFLNEAGDFFEVFLAAEGGAGEDEVLFLGEVEEDAFGAEVAFSDLVPGEGGVVFF